MASLTISSYFTASRNLSRVRSQPQLHPHANSSLSSLKSISRIHKPSSTRTRSATVVKASLGFSGSYYEGDFDYDYDGDGTGEEEGFGLGMSTPNPTAAVSVLEDKEELPCPPGCRRYECIVVLKPDVSEEKRVAFIQQYEEILVAGGAMYVEVFNRGVAPLSYSVQKVNRDGTKDTYGDGVYLLFTFFTKPESIGVLDNQLRLDFTVIRYSVMKVEKLKEEKKGKKERMKVPAI